MQYWIARNNQKLGPYSLADVQRMMADGKLVSSDLAWTQGMASWGPVFDVIPAPQAAAPEPPPGPQALAPTRMVETYRPPPETGGPGSVQPAVGQPYQPVQPQSQPIPAPTRPIFMPTQQFQAPAQAEQQPFSAPVHQQQPAPAQAFTPQPAVPEPAPIEIAMASQVGQPYQPLPPGAQPFPAPPAAQPFQAQPFQSQPFQSQPFAQPYPAPPAAQPFQAQPYPPQPQPGQPYPYPGQPAPAGGLVPPGMHWALVLVLGSVTFGIFYIVWFIKQINFIKRIDPVNPAGKLVMLGLLLCVVYGAMVGGAIVLQSSTVMLLLGSAGLLIELGASACIIVAYFKMRSALLNYYNTVEPIGLRLSGAMTLFFNILYFQHHFHRIAEWKRTGVLAPQK